MAITFPITFPSYNAARNIRLIARDTVSAFRDPFSAVEQVHDFGGQWWESVVTLPPMERAKAEQYASFLWKLNGIKGTFKMGVSSAGTSRGSPSGTPVVQSVTFLGQTITTDTWGANSTQVLAEGDYIQIEDHIYKVLEDATTDGSGETDIEIWPALRPDAVTGTSTITYSDPVGLWRLAENMRTIEINVAKHYGISFACVEALRQ